MGELMTRIVLLVRRTRKHTAILKLHIDISSHAISIVGEVVHGIIFLKTPGCRLFYRLAML